MTTFPRLAAVAPATALTCLALTCLVSAAEPRIDRDIEYAAVGDVRLRLDLYRPPADDAAPRRPLILWIHGGAWRGGSKADVPILPLVERGYAIASVDYRLSTQAEFPAQLHDLKGAVRYLRASAPRYELDPERFVAAGSSAGGHLAALLGTTGGNRELAGTVGGNPDTADGVQAILDWFGPTDLTTILSQSTPHGLNVRVPALELLLGGQPAEKSALARAASPTFHVDAADPPLMIFHGDRDPQVPINQSHQLHGEYLRVGATAEFDVIYGGAHGGREFFDAKRLNRAAEFLEKSLRPKPSK